MSPKEYSDSNFRRKESLHFKYFFKIYLKMNFKSF